MDNTLLSSINIRFGDYAFNLLAIESGEPVNLEKAICIVFWLNIHAAFLFILSKPQLYFCVIEGF